MTKARNVPADISRNFIRRKLKRLDVAFLMHSLSVNPTATVFYYFVKWQTISFWQTLFLCSPANNHSLSTVIECRHYLKQLHP
jgi:hypothetical protein